MSTENLSPQAPKLRAATKTDLEKNAEELQRISDAFQKRSPEFQKFFTTVGDRFPVLDRLAHGFLRPLKEMQQNETNQTQIFNSADLEQPLQDVVEDVEKNS